MTTNRFDERVMTLVEAAGWLERRFGRRPNAATVWRWAIKGLRGVRLRTISLGRYRYTTEESLEQFITDTSLSEAANRTCNQASPTAISGEDASFTEPEMTAARRRCQAANEKARQFLRQNLGSSRPPREKRA
jgi:hypothetical protein